jgi:prepilin-type N-terminal cleavage/methylation domain-containing protein
MKKTRRTAHGRGFTLLELMIATAVFLVISGAGLALFSRQQPLFNRQQNLAGLNIAVRNAVSQLQLDVVNAGNGTLLGTNMPNAPVGISVSNSMPTTACNTPATFTYSSTCFDTLNIIAADLAVPAAHPDNGTLVPNSGTNCVNTNTATTMYLYPPAGTSQAAATALAGTSPNFNFKTGDEILLVKSDGSQMTTVKLTANAAVFHVGALYGVQLTYNATNASGVNTTANDPLLITTTAGGPFGVQYCSVVDWVVRLDPITYQVDTTTPSDPKLVRLRGGANQQTLAEQVIGFKVGAVTWNAGFTTPDDNAAYNYFASNLTTDPTHPGYNNQFWLVRSVQMSLIARTTPTPDATYTYRNGFDSGPYQIESVSVVVNPRNLTMNNN